MRNLFLYRYIVSFLLLLFLGACTFVTPSSRAPHPSLPENSDAQTSHALENPSVLTRDQMFYDFNMDEDGKYFSEALFPHPEVLQTLKQKWETEWLTPPKPDQQDKVFKAEFQDRMREEKKTCGLLWAYTDDFNGDGKMETFFCYGASGFLYEDVAWLCFADADGNLQELAKRSYFRGWVIRYPSQAQLMVASDYGTGLSLVSFVYGYNGIKASELLSTSQSVFYKDGCFLTAMPRAGSAYQIYVTSYWWDEQSNAYQLLPCVEIALDQLPSGVPPESDSYPLSRAATIANHYYYAVYARVDQTDWIQPYLLEKNGALTEYSNPYSYELDTLLIGKTQDFDYDKLVENALSVSSSPALSKDTEDKIIAFLQEHVDSDSFWNQPDWTIQIRQIKRDGADWYQVSGGFESPIFFYISTQYYVNSDFSRIQKADSGRRDIQVWPTMQQ